MIEAVARTKKLGAGQLPYLAIALYVVAYIILDRVSYVAPVRPFNITPWTPQPGLSIAFLVIIGLRYWPMLLVSAVLAEFLVRFFPAPVAYEFLNALVMAAGYATIAFLLKRRLRGRAHLQTLRDLAWFVGCTIALSLPVAATYVAVLTFARLLPTADFVFNTTMFWMGDVIGVIITTPALLIAWQFVRSRVKKLNLTREVILQACALFLTAWIVFGLPDTDQFKFFYLLFVPLIWIAVRDGFVGAIICIVCIQLALISWAYLRDEQSVTVLELQGLMLALAIAGQFLGMAVTESRAAQSALLEREEELQQALRLAAASEMYTAIAHELNQPLAATSHFAWASRKIAENAGITNPDLLETLDSAIGEAHRAGAVTQRLRDLYLGGMVHRESADVNDLIKTAVTSVAARLSRHGISLRTDLPEVPVFLNIDPIQITAVLHNLVSNAIEALTSDLAGDRPDHLEIAVAVVNGSDMTIVAVDDNGPGIAADMVDRVFAAFASDKATGLGLGLAICRTIVEAHGGRIWIETSRLGGARFCFSLPRGDQ
jgi:signal transduction histidine kinase